MLQHFMKILSLLSFLNAIQWTLVLFDCAVLHTLVCLLLIFIVVYCLVLCKKSRQRL